MATILHTPSEILDPPVSRGTSATIPDATKLDLVDLWHNDERISEVARAFKANDSASVLQPAYASDEQDFLADQPEHHQGRVIPSSRFWELTVRRLTVASEAQKADAAKFAATESEEQLDDTLEDGRNSDDDDDDDSDLDDEPPGPDGEIPDSSPDAGSGNMLGIPLQRPPSLTQRTLDCGASIALRLLSTVALEDPVLLKDILRSIRTWLAHCVPCSLSPHTGYSTILSTGTVRRLLSFLLAAWRKGNHMAVKLAIQLAISRGELPLLVEVAWGLLGDRQHDPEAPADDGGAAKGGSAAAADKKQAAHGAAVLRELERVKTFLFSTYCPSRRLDVPSCLRAERRVAVGPGIVQGLAVSNKRASVLIAMAGHSSVLQVCGGDVDKRLNLPFVVDSDALPSLACASDGRSLAIAPTNPAVQDTTSPDHVLFYVNVCENFGGSWRQYRLRIPHAHKPLERVICKVVSYGDTDRAPAADLSRPATPTSPTSRESDGGATVTQGRKIGILSASSVLVDEKSALWSSPLTSAQRRLQSELQGFPEWEAAVAHVRANTISMEMAVESVMEAMFRDGRAATGDANTQIEEIASLLQVVVRYSDRLDDAEHVAMPKVSFHWVELPPPDGASPLKRPEPATIVGPTHTVNLSIPQTSSRRNRHHQSALSLTRNSLPEFSYPLPKLNRDQPCTLEAWVRGAVDSPATILCWGVPEYRVHLSIDRQKRHTLYFVGSTTKQQHRGVSASVPGADSHHWVHLCVTHDGNNNWSLYRNGNLIGEPHMKDAHDKPAEAEDVTAQQSRPNYRVPRTSSIPDMRQSDRTMHGSVGNAFVGCVAEARIWTECRSPDQIKAYLHTSLPPRECAADSSLLAYWPMDQAVGVQAYDHSSHRRHLLLQDGAGWEHVPDMPVFRRTNRKPEGWPVYLPSLRNLSVFAAEKELLLSVPKSSSGSAIARVISTYDATSGCLLRERLAPIGVSVVSQGVAAGSEGGAIHPLDGPLALDAITGDIWALSQPTGLLMAGTGASSGSVIDDEPIGQPAAAATGQEQWWETAGKAMLTVLASLSRRHTAAAPAVLSALYLSPVVSCLKQLCQLLALGRKLRDVELCKGAAGLLNACFSQNGWSVQAIQRNRPMLEELYKHACAIVDDDSWTTPVLSATVEDSLQSGVSAGVFFPSTTSKVAEFQKLLQYGSAKPLSKSEHTVLNVLVQALAGASAHYLLRGAPVSDTLRQLLLSAKQPNAPPLLRLAVALQRCVVALASTNEDKAIERLVEYMTELFKIAREEPPEAPTATSILVPLLLGSLPLLHKKLSAHCDLPQLLGQLRDWLVVLSEKLEHTGAVSLTQAATTFWHEIRMNGSTGLSVSCAAYEFGAATSIILTIDTLGDFTVVYWDPNRPGSLLHTTEMCEMRQPRVTLETSRLVIAEIQKESRRRRRTGAESSVRPVSGVLRAFGTETAPRTGWLLDLLATVFAVSALISATKSAQLLPASQPEYERVSTSIIFQGGITDTVPQDLCLELIDGTETGLQLWKDLEAANGNRLLPGGQGTTTMVRAMLAALLRLTLPGEVKDANVLLFAALLSIVEMHRETICTKLRSADDGDDLVIDTFVKRCRFIVTKVRPMDLHSKPQGFSRRASNSEITDKHRRLQTTADPEDNALLAVKELLRLCVSTNLDLEELETVLVSQKKRTEKRAEGFETCDKLIRAAFALNLDTQAKGFVVLEVLRIAVASVVACGTHPLANCHGAGPATLDAALQAFFKLLKTALDADTVVEETQKPHLQSLQMALLNFDWNERDLFFLESVGALQKLYENCSLPTDETVAPNAKPLHLAPELWRGRSTIGLLTLKLSSDALGAAIYCPPGTEGTVYEQQALAANTSTAELEVLHTTTPWVLDPPSARAARDVTAGCEYFEVTLASLPMTQTSDRHAKHTIAIGLARAPPADGGPPKQYVWWKSDGSFMADVGPEPPSIPESSTQLTGERGVHHRTGAVLVGYVSGQTIGCGVLKGTNEIYFTRNGHLVGFHAAVPGGMWYPSIWLGSKACLQCRFSAPFKFAARHPFVKPLSDVEVLQRTVRAQAWRAMTSAALKAAKFGLTDQRVVGPITKLISTGINTILATSNSTSPVKWGRARAALLVLVRVAAGKGSLKPLVSGATTNALFRLAADPDAPLLLRVQALGVLCPIVSQSSPDEWDGIIQSITTCQSSAAVGTDWKASLTRAFLLLNANRGAHVQPPRTPLEPSNPGDGMIRLLADLMLPCLPFLNTGQSALAVASSCLLRALLGSPSWQATVAAALKTRLLRFAQAVRECPTSIASIMDSSTGAGFLVALRVLGALPSMIECGMRVLVHSPGASTLATVTEWHQDLTSARVLADGVTREVSVTRLEPADGCIACSGPLPSPEVGGLLHASLEATEAAVSLVRATTCDTTEAESSIANPLPHLQWLAEVACRRPCEAEDTSSHITLLSTLTDAAGRVGVSELNGVPHVVPFAISNWLLVGCLRLLEGYAQQYPKATRDVLVSDRTELLTSIAELCKASTRGWSPETACSPSRAHLEALSIQQISTLHQGGWGTVEPVLKPMKPPRRTLKVEPRVELEDLSGHQSHSCDGCGYQPLQNDTHDFVVGWYRCNTCEDFDLCGRCFRRGIIHGDHGHTFTDISQLVAVNAAARKEEAQAQGPHPTQELEVSVLPAPAGAKRFISMLIAISDKPLPWVECLVSDTSSGGNAIAALFPAAEDDIKSLTSPRAEPVMNTAGYPSIKGPDGIRRCGAVVDAEALCRCGYCSMYATSRCGPTRGCSCQHCQALDRRTPDCVVDMQGIREHVAASSHPVLWVSLLDVSHALCSIAARGIITTLAPEEDIMPSDITNGTKRVQPSSLTRLLPQLLNWPSKWDEVADFVIALQDHCPRASTTSTSAALAMVECVVEFGGTQALHAFMGRLLALSCLPVSTQPLTLLMWKVLGRATYGVRVSQSPSLMSNVFTALLPNQEVVQVARCGKWLQHQYGWSPTEWDKRATMIQVPSSSPPTDAVRRSWIFRSSFDASIGVLRPLLLGAHGSAARDGRWQLSTLLGTPAVSQKGVTILAALLATAHRHSGTRRRDALALVADLLPVILKAHTGKGTPLTVTEGVEALAPLLRHVFSAHREAPLSQGAPVWHAALELLVRLRRGLQSADSSDILDDLVQSEAASKAKDSIFALIEAFEDTVERIAGANPVPLPVVLTTSQQPNIPRVWFDSDSSRSSKHYDSRRSRHDRIPNIQSTSLTTFLPAPVPDVHPALIGAYRWGRPGRLREALHPVLNAKQWMALALLVSSIRQCNLFNQNVEAVYRALQHHIHPSDVTAASPIVEAACGISIPLPDLSKPELAACLTTLQNINAMLLIPIVYYLDLTPHGISHSSLSKSFMAIKGLLLTQCKDSVVNAALKQTEVDGGQRPCLSFNRFTPNSHIDDSKDGHPYHGHTTLLPQLHSHLSDGSIQLACSTQAFSVKFSGEEGIDVGGLYKDLLSSISQELMSPSSNLFFQCDNRFYVNPNCTNPEELALLGTVGRLMGTCLRTGDTLGIDLHPLFWKKLVWEPCSKEDHYDVEFFRTLDIARAAVANGRALSEEEFADLMLFFAVPGQQDHLKRSLVHDLVPNGRNLPVTLSNRFEYWKLAAEAKMKESDLQVEAIRNGLLEVVPNIALTFLSSQEFEIRICGRPEVDIDELRKNAKYGTLPEEESADLWKALKSFNRLDRQRFLRFVTGRFRIPHHQPIHIRLERTTLVHRKDALPTAHTCFNQLDIPRYSSSTIFRRQLLTAIRHCESTDVV
ncbi:E3 ubiquitin-protein ligase TOM1-like [Diplonema papillatum]|nr:E3 ubiquitin-protein ligase TOM1-like [Diplonema papillatum]